MNITKLSNLCCYTSFQQFKVLDLNHRFQIRLSVGWTLEVYQCSFFIWKVFDPVSILLYLGYCSFLYIGHLLNEEM